jgi:hypothetical protein
VSAAPAWSLVRLPDRLEKAVKSSGFDRHLPAVNPNGKGLRGANRLSGAIDLRGNHGRMVPIFQNFRAAACNRDGANIGKLTGNYARPPQDCLTRRRMIRGNGEQGWL